MRVFAVLFFAFVLIFAFVYADEAVTEQSDECYDKDLDIKVKRGETNYPENECLRLTCPESGPLRVEPCEFAVGPNCRIVDGDLSKQYPACCSTVECD